MNVCVRVCVYMQVCVRTRVCVCACVFMCDMCAHIFARMSGFIYAHIHVPISNCVFTVHVSIYVYVCTYM